MAKSWWTSVFHWRRQPATAETSGPIWLVGMSWREFELLVSDAFQMRGYIARQVGAVDVDGGADLVLRRGKDIFLVDCKQWRAAEVGVDPVRQLSASVTAQRATGGFVLTSGSFTAEAKAYAQARDVELVDGPQLHAMVRDAQAARSAETAPAPLMARPSRHGGHE